MLAAESLYGSVVPILLQGGADCKLVDTMQRTPLHYCVANAGPADEAAVSACEGIIQQLCDAGVSVRLRLS